MNKLSGNYRLLALDMDGTLLDSNKKIRPATFSAIREAANAGIEVVLSTGRALSELKDYQEELSVISYGICESGALIYDFQNSRILRTETIVPDTVDALLKTGRQEDVMFQAFFHGQTYVSKEEMGHMGDYQMEIYQPMYERCAVAVDDIDSFIQEHHDQLEKLNLFHDSVEARERTFEKVKELEGTFAYSEITSLETSPRGISKAKGIHFLCQKLGIPVEQTIAVGDAPNDLSMLKIAGLAVAMGNASSEIKNACHITVKDNDHDGIAELINAIL